MKLFIIILSLVLTACNSQVTTEQQEKNDSAVHEHTALSTELNDGVKWKADEATKRNVAALAAVINESNYSNDRMRNEFSAKLQEHVDTLIKECRMKGPDHDALHAWLEKVLKGMKKLKDEDEEFGKVRAELKKDVERFYVLFE